MPAIVKPRTLQAMPWGISKIEKQYHDMTEKQAETLRQKIKRVKLDLAADKRRWGGFYDDSRGLRYLPTQYYIRLGDFSGGLKYLKWFQKNFPEDSGFPDFLFEWTIILFKTGNIRQAEKKAFETYCSNTYILDKFFGSPIIPLDKYEFSNVAMPDFVENFNYSSKQPELIDFSDWLEKFIRTEKFSASRQQYVDLYKRLKTENDAETRGYLIKQARQLEEQF